MKKTFQDRKNLTPACNECNSSLSDIYLTTIPTRAAYLLGLYRRKYKKLLREDTWTEDELAELGSVLRSSLITQQTEATRMRERLDHLFVVSQGYIND